MVSSQKTKNKKTLLQRLKWSHFSFLKIMMILKLLKEAIVQLEGWLNRKSNTWAVPRNRDQMMKAVVGLRRWPFGWVLLRPISSARLWNKVSVGRLVGPFSKSVWGSWMGIKRPILPLDTWVRRAGNDCDNEAWSSWSNHPSPTRTGLQGTVMGGRGAGSCWKG